tara:strand:+ start:1418 stop:1750 length:333 start_codon:yes stop_codon:yes gene_type:complete
MTAFTNENLDYHGGYLMFRGDYEGRPVYEDKPNVHPTRVGKGIDLFIARFKYGGAPFTKANYVKELKKNWTVEEYAAKRAEGMTPHAILEEKNPQWAIDIMAKWKAKKGL